MASSKSGPSTPEVIDAESLTLIKLEVERFQQLGDFTPAQVLAFGHEALIRRLVAKVEVGTASVSEQRLLAQILKDNGMVMGLDKTLGLPVANEPLELPSGCGEVPALPKYEL